MLLTQEKNTLESNMEMKQSQFGIGNMEIVLDILTKLYSNPIQTLTQEYISNARDAMREAKNAKDTIQITIPTSLNPILKIRDYGIGLSEERINGVFLLYGNSTKRSSNEQTGGFGIGAKSAWSYTDSFNVTSFYNGYKSVYICHKSNSNGNMDRIVHEKTEEKNGVLIEIAVKPSDIRHFENAVKRTIYFWKDSEKPDLKNEHLDDVVVGYKIGQIEFIKDLPEYVNSSGYSQTNGLVIDGIYYKLSENILKKIKIKDKLYNMLKSNSSIIIHLENGQVQIAPNREEIIDNDLTINCLEKIYSQAILRIVNEIDSKFKNCKEIKDHIEVYSELTNTFNVDRKVGDYELSEGVIYNAEIGSEKNWGGWNRSSSNKNGALTEKAHQITGRYGNRQVTDKIVNERKGYVSFSDIENELLFYIDKEISAVGVNNHVRTLLESGCERIILIPNNLKDVANDLNAKNLSEVAITKIDRVARAKISNESFRIYHWARYGNRQVTKTTTDMKALDKFYWTRNGENHAEIARFLRKEDKQAFLLTKKAEKVLSGLENAVYIGDYINEFKDDGRDFNTFVNCNLSYSSLLNLIDANKVKDKTFRKMKGYSGFKHKGNLPESLVSEKTDKRIKEFDKLNNEFKAYIKKEYPLIGNINLTKENIKDVIEYINLKYKK